MLLKTIHAHRSSLPQVYCTKQVLMLRRFSFLPGIRMYDMSFHPIGSVGKNQCPTKISMSRPSPSPSPVQVPSNICPMFYPNIPFYIYIFLDIVQDITNSLSKSRPVPSKSRPSPSPSPIPTLSKGIQLYC